MALYKYLRQAWQTPNAEVKQVEKERLILWRKQPGTLRVDYPTRLDRARSLGYKAKNGIIVVRQRVPRGGRMRPHELGGRRPKHNRLRKILDMNYQTIAEQRVNAKYPNCEVLNSYFVAKDGLHYWYEIILVDKSHPEILADDRLRWIAEKQHTGRVYRGKTSSARKSRGLRNKGTGAEKMRPSKSAVWRKKINSWGYYKHQR